jgi:hypothetical protein
MKINEIISEAGIGQAVGKAAHGLGKAAGTTVRAAGDFHSGFKAGQKKMDKILSPSKWFGNDKDQSSDSTTDKLKAKQSLQRVAAERPIFKDDQDELKQLYQDVKAGKIDAGADQQALLQAIKAAYNQQPLNKQQLQMLQQYSTTL